MKFKPLSLLAGAVALTLTATPFAVQAQMRSFSPQLAQNAKPERGQKGAGWSRLELTDAQKAQMQAIKTNTRAQIEALLTAEQKATLAAAQQARQAQRQSGQGQGQRPQKDWTNLNLTPQQQTQMRQIRETSKQQMLAVLNPQQRQQLQEMQQNMRSRRQQRNSQ
ncbi:MULTISPECIES: P pilus assembly/Cpx signaling pathway, periplasmic inhibitor/zinc-resistance associated protein [unclassified Anabaena]|uniref:P pilus assembly/Cpx signaling pathway, periplasmic inhibitor/zinc-resistance associated protein n=1 Tax=unclassified Anabaena TaxID=2619674 RepID=UPI0039C6CEA4